MNKKINLCELLRDCLKGTRFWSPIFGDMEFMGISESTVAVEDKFGSSWDINSDSTFTICGNKSEEPMLYPSREQRDWSKWQCQKPKKPKFDPKTLKPFDKVIARNEYDEWSCTLFSHTNNRPDTRFIYETCESVYEYCIPYNDDTKHLVGTTDEAPEYYRYWED